ncbi:MAG: hypothetical protein APR63_09010 [Desulfuromonas sp. SDB]|nr:MAG: hypothetical protein APR63_09010 [Desulfuromonas sp. SDB]
MNRSIIFTFYILLSVLILPRSLRGVDSYGDHVPPELGPDSRWTSLSLPFSLQYDHQYQLDLQQRDSIASLVENDLEQKATAVTSNYRYPPQIIIYHGDDEYHLEIGSLKGLTPGFPLNNPQGVEVNFQGKYLNRSQWCYSLHFASEQSIPRSGVAYSVIEIELGNGKGYLPLVILFAQTTPSLQSRGVR